MLRKQLHRKSDYAELMWYSYIKKATKMKIKNVDLQFN